MKVETFLPQNLEDIPAASRRAETLGFDAVLATEVWNNPFNRLTLAAEHTSSIELATGISLAFVRSPMTMAYIALDLQRFSGGRLYLGLGAQTQWQIERRFGMSWSAPAPRMRDYVRVMQAAWDTWITDRPFDYQGEVFHLDVMTPNHRPPSTLMDGVPFPKISFAAVGPAMNALAGQLGDGVRLHGFGTKKAVEQNVIPNLRKGAKRENRSLRGFDISGGGMIATAPDAKALEAEIDRVRYEISYYGHFPEYQHVWEIEGLAAIGLKLQEYAKAERWKEMPSLIDEDILHCFAAVGKYEEIGERILDRFGSFASRVSLPIPNPEHEEKLLPSIRLLQETPVASVDDDVFPV